MLRHTLGRLAGLALVPVALAFSSAVPVLAESTANAEPTVTISASTTPDWFDVHLANLHSKEVVHYFLSGPGQQSFGGSTHTAGDGGNLTFNFKMPRAAMAGTWAMTLQGEDGDMVVGTFTAAMQAPDVTLKAGQVADTADTMVVVSTKKDSFRKHEPVNYWLMDPSGAVVQSGMVDTSKNGKLDLDLTLGADAAHGTWTIAVYGIHDDHYGMSSINIG